MDSSKRYPLQLVDVRLYEAHLTRPDKHEVTERSEDGFQLNIEIGLDRMPPDRVLVLLTLNAKGDEDPFDIMLVLEGLFEANCDLDQLDDEFWQEFRAVSAPTLIWPYARECVSTITWRMRLDLPMLPTLNRFAMAVPSTDDTPPADAELDSENAGV